MTKWEKLMDIGIEDFNRLKEPELRQVVRQLNRTANQRLRRAEARGMETPATAAVKRSGGTFTTRGKNLNQLRAEFRRVTDFLQSKTSTYKGFQQVKKETAASLEKQGVEIDPAKLDETMRVYERLKESNPWIQARGFKYATFQEIDKMPDDMSIEDKISAMQEQLDQLYEQAVENEAEFETGVSGFFV